MGSSVQICQSHGVFGISYIHDSHDISSGRLRRIRSTGVDIEYFPVWAPVIPSEEVLGALGFVNETKR